MFVSSRIPVPTFLQVESALTFTSISGHHLCAFKPKTFLCPILVLNFLRRDPSNWMISSSLSVSVHFENDTCPQPQNMAPRASLGN